MFTAIVLNDAARTAVLTLTAEKQCFHTVGTGGDFKLHAHHCTLNLGPAKDKNKLGSVRKLTVTGYGVKVGRVIAVRVTGAEDSKNTVPHVTVATLGDAKPKESNEIEVWHDCAPFDIFGEIHEVKG